MAIQTGSTYISDSMTDIIIISTLNLRFSTRTRAQKLSTSDCNIGRPPEIAIWPPKTGNSYITGTTTDSVEIPTAYSGFSVMASPNNVSSSDCDYDRQPEMAAWPAKPKILISLKLWQIGWQFQRQIWGFRHAKLEETDNMRLQQRPTTESDNI